MDTVPPDIRSRIMSKVRSKGNLSTEVKLISLLREKKLKGWRRNYKLLGKPDIVYPKAKIAVFVDGCFWHGCPKHCRLPSSNKEYWIPKIEKNRERDRNTTSALRKNGWRVIRIWEHEIGTTQLSRKFRIIRQAIES